MDDTSSPSPGLDAGRPPRRARLAPPHRLFGVNYDDYCRIRDDERNNGLRMTYVDGVLEIMSPEYLHESGSRRLGILVMIVAEVNDIDCTGAGNTTFRRGQAGQQKGKGKEPDQSFYIGHEPSIRDKQTLALERDPSPDLWIEVDNRGSSSGRLPVYAAFGVPEVWQYRPRRRGLRFLRLDVARTGYDEIDRSLSLPMLTPDQVLFALDQCLGRSESAWSRWLRGWAAGLPNP